MDADERSAFRTLQLPCRHTSEDQCVAKLSELVKQEAGPNTSSSAWVEVELAAWDATGAASASLKRACYELFKVAEKFEPESCRQYYKAFAGKYFDAHAALLNSSGQTFTEARATLEQASLIIELAIEGQLSAARIARMMSQNESKALISRQVIAEVLRFSSAQPRISLAQIQSIFDLDSKEEVAAFKDASFEVAVEELSSISARYLDGSSLFQALRVLSPRFGDGGKLVSDFTPYLQMLHYQCSICEFYDHYVNDLYEFSPRGQAANWLFDKYPMSIASASNPFLNNAKSVEVIDESWVRSKKNAETPGARALLAVLGALDRVNFLARRELARWIRMWIHRILKSAQYKCVAFPEAITFRQFVLLAEYVAMGNTKTYGIVEQRFVDALAAISNASLRPRGLGDAVNASNVSRKKFGDCEFVDNTKYSIMAYEAHGGGLSDIYVKQHILSLVKTVPHRVDELEMVADMEQWNAKVTFIAHDLGNVGAMLATVEGLKFEIEMTTFVDFSKKIFDYSPEEVEVAFNNHFIRAINSRWTPESVRGSVARIICA
ncbi:thioredoxin domain-containing protein [Stenotrophomonas muris]|uniref:hypothetical protein n=1 Tax=Stenotrophomonas muris TaxID=2963283 RepID=UPI00383B6608